MPTFSFTAVAGCPHKAYLAYLKKWLPRAAEHVKKPPREIAISLLGATKMAVLHERFLGIPGPTDVLTFELEHDSRNGKRCTAGEVVICVSHARKQARQRGMDVRRELLLYGLHGLLHLSGFDDRTAKSFKKMHDEEDRILTAIGIGPVFDQTNRDTGQGRR